LAFLAFLLDALRKGWQCWAFQDRLLSPLALGIAAGIAGSYGAHERGRFPWPSDATIGLAGCRPPDSHAQDVRSASGFTV